MFHLKALLQEDACSDDKEVGNFLLEFRISPKNKGYDYLRECITIISKEPRTIYSLTTKLYPTVANKYSTTPFAVERAIRYSIAKAWKQYGHFLWNNFHFKPSNGEFIAYVVERFSPKMI